MTHTLTSFQTVGPYFSIGLSPLYTNNLAQYAPLENSIKIEGRVIDSEGKPIPDAVIEIWQADSYGHYNADITNNSSFRGFGRCAVDDKGHYQFDTIKPGPVPYTDGRLQAPHIAVNLQMRGLLNQLITRIYFADEPANEVDPVLHLVQKERRDTLIAVKNSDNIYQFNFIMQGIGETVFFDF